MESCSLCYDLKCCPEHCCDWDTCECMDCEDCGPKNTAHVELGQDALYSTEIETLEKVKTHIEDSAIIINFGELQKSQSQKTAQVQAEETKKQDIIVNLSVSELQEKPNSERMAAGRGLFGIRAIRNSRN